MSGINIHNINDNKLRGDKLTNRFNFANNSRMEILKRAREAININKNKKMRNDKGAFYPFNRAKQQPQGSLLRMPPTALSVNNLNNNYSIQKGGGRYTPATRNKFTNLLGKRKEQFEAKALAKQGLRPIKEEAKKTETKNSLINLNVMIDELETEISDGRWEDIDLKQVRGIFNEIKKVGYDMNIEEITNYRIKLGAITRFYDYLEDQGEELFKETIYYGIFSSILLLMVFEGTINLQKKERTIIINTEIKVISKLESFDGIINLFDDYRVRFNLPSVRRQAEARMNNILTDQLPRKERKLRDKIDDMTNKTKAEMAIQAQQKIAELAEEDDAKTTEVVGKIINALKTEGVNKNKTIQTKYGKMKIKDIPYNFAIEDIKENIEIIKELREKRLTRATKKKIDEQEQLLKTIITEYMKYKVIPEDSFEFFDGDEEKSDDSKDSDYVPDEQDIKYFPTNTLKTKKNIEDALEDALQRNDFQTFEEFAEGLINDEIEDHLLDYMQSVAVNTILADKIKTIEIFEKKIDVVDLLELIAQEF